MISAAAAGVAPVLQGGGDERREKGVVVEGGRSLEVLSRRELRLLDNFLLFFEVVCFLLILFILITS